MSLVAWHPEKLPVAGSNGRTVPGHLMRPSEAKDEFSEAGTCRAQAGNEPEAKLEFSCLTSREAASGRFEWSNGIY